jgi:hypothetical protein
VYVPVTVLVAWPVAHLLGLMPQRAPRPIRIGARELRQRRLRELAPLPQPLTAPATAQQLVASVQQRT